MLKLVIFDCDGTLYNNIGGIVQGLDFALSQHGYFNTNLSDVKYNLARPFNTMVGDLISLPADNATTTAIAETYHNHMIEQDTGDLYPNTIATLESLKNAGYLMAMVTGMGGRGVDRLFATYPIAPYFDAVKHGDNGANKPDPTSLYDIVKTLGIASVSDVVMIGDSLADMHYAQNANCPSIGVTWGNESEQSLTTTGNATTIAHDMTQIPTLVHQTIGNA